MKYKITDAVLHYENLVVQFEGIKQAVFIPLSKLNGCVVKGKIVFKRTRNWLE